MRMTVDTNPFAMLLCVGTGALLFGSTAKNVDAFSPSSSFLSSSTKIQRTPRQTNHAMAMYIQEASATTSTNPIMKENPSRDILSKRNANSRVNDTTHLGSLEVPNVGIGTISWSSDSFFGLENDELKSLVTHAYESNAAFFDTAERYGSHLKAAIGMGWGETERLTKKFLDEQESKEDDDDSDKLAPVVATKFTPTPWRTTVESVVQACEDSRQRLGVEQIDLYQLHMPDIVQPFRFLGKVDSKDEIYWEGLAECYNRGLVKNVGVCNYGPTLLTRCHAALAKRGVPLASNQIAYSLVGRHNGSQETLEKANELGVKTLAFYPLAMGLLTGKYTSVDKQMKLAGETLQSLTNSKKTKFEESDLLRYVNGDGADIPMGGLSPLLALMEGIADKREKTVAQVALNYIICKGALPIPGARTAAQVEDNMGAMGWRLSEDEIRMLEHAADSLGINFEGAGFKRTSEKFVGYGVESWSLD